MLGKYIVCVPLENQFYGVMMCATDQSMDQSYGSCAKDQSNGNMLYVQRTNPMGHDTEPDACTEDQSYGTVHVVNCT